MPRAPKEFFGVVPQTLLTDEDLDRMAPGQGRHTSGWSSRGARWSPTNRRRRSTSRASTRSCSRPPSDGDPRDPDDLRDPALGRRGPRRQRLRRRRAPRTRRSSDEALADVEGLRRPAGRPLRTRRRALEDAPRGRPGADPHLADLERAELADLLPARGRPGRLREAASSAASDGDHRARPRGRGDPRRDVRDPVQGQAAGAQRLGLPAPAVRDRRRPRQPSTRVAAHPYAAHEAKIEAAGRAPARRDRARRRRRRALDHRGRRLLRRGQRTRSSAGPRARPSSSAAPSSSSSTSARSWNIEGVTWYSWRDTSDPPSATGAPGSGLFEETSLTPKPAWDAFVSFTGGS